MTRITIQHGDGAPVTLHIDPASATPVHLHLDSGPNLAAGRPALAGPDVAPSIPASRPRRRWKTVVPAVCVGLLGSVVLIGAQSAFPGAVGTGDVAGSGPASTLLPPLPGGPINGSASSDPSQGGLVSGNIVGLSGHSAVGEVDAARRAMMQGPTTQWPTDSYPRARSSGTAGGASVAPVAPTAPTAPVAPVAPTVGSPSTGKSPFGLEN